MADLTLIGYRYSVYTRVVRMLLAEKRLEHAYIEVDPFSEETDADLLAANPFHRVPVLRHGRFTLYETAAITQYLDQSFLGQSFVPADLRAQARMRQIIGLVDSDVYPVLVRQVYAHAVFRPAFGVAPDTAVIEAGLAASGRILAALEAIATEGVQFLPDRSSLADLHLAPMLAGFVAANEGRALLTDCPALSDWFDRMTRRESFIATEVALPKG